MNSLQNATNIVEIANLIFSSGLVDDSINFFNKAKEILKECEYDTDNEVNELQREVEETKGYTKSHAITFQDQLAEHPEYVIVKTITELEIAMKLLMNRLWKNDKLFVICDEKEKFPLTKLTDNEQIVFNREKIKIFKQTHH